MRFRLLRRRLTISAPRMAVRSALPWPLRWAAIAVMMGFCAAIGLWAFEFGKTIAGLDRDARHELEVLRAEVRALRAERDQAQSVANTSDSLLTAERAAQDHLTLKIRQLEADNRALRDDLGFFEVLMPAGNGEDFAIRGLQAETVGSPEAGAQLKWQLLVIQPVKNAAEFRGSLALTLTGLRAGKPWTLNLPEPQAFQMRQYRRLDGMIDLPPQAVVQTVTAKVLQGSTAKVVQVLKL